MVGWAIERQLFYAFTTQGSATIMRDTLSWRSPFGAVGIVADRIVVARHMRAYMMAKQSVLKLEAESTAARVAGLSTATRGTPTE